MGRTNLWAARSYGFRSAQLSSHPAVEIARADLLWRRGPLQTGKYAARTLFDKTQLPFLDHLQTVPGVRKLMAFG